MQIAETLFFVIKLICLTENFTAIAYKLALVKIKKVIFWRKNYFPASVQLPLKSRTIRVQQKMKLRRSRKVKYLFYKNNAKKSGAFHMRIKLKGNTKIICDICSKLSIQAQSSVIDFHFEQLSIIPVVSLLLLRNIRFGSFVFFNTSFLSFKI